MPVRSNDEAEKIFQEMFGRKFGGLGTKKKAPADRDIKAAVRDKLIRGEALTEADRRALGAIGTVGRLSSSRVEDEPDVDRRTPLELREDQAGPLAASAGREGRRRTQLEEEGLDLSDDEMAAAIEGDPVIRTERSIQAGRQDSLAIADRLDTLANRIGEPVTMETFERVKGFEDGLFELARTSVATGDTAAAAAAFRRQYGIAPSTARSFVRLMVPDSPLFAE